MGEKIYQGTSKSLYESEEEYSLVMSFNDKVRKSGKESLIVHGKGIINNHISAYIMQSLDMIGIENHFIQKNNMNQQLIQLVDVLPIQVNICTIACGRYVTDFDIEDGFVFESPIIDFRVKNKDLNYPIINEEQMISFSWLSKYEIKILKKTVIRIHDFLSGLFATAGIRLVDIKLEFGRVFNGEEFMLMLVDEISPDTCRLWDMNTNQKLCYEIVNEGADAVFSAYKEVMNRLNINIKL